MLTNFLFHPSPWSCKERQECHLGDSALYSVVGWLRDSLAFNFSRGKFVLFVIRYLVLPKAPLTTCPHRRPCPDRDHSATFWEIARIRRPNMVGQKVSLYQNRRLSMQQAQAVDCSSLHPAGIETECAHAKIALTNNSPSGDILMHDRTCHKPQYINISADV